MRVFRPNGLPIEEDLFSVEGTGCAVSVYTLNDAFSAYAAEHGIDFLNSATSEKVAPEERDGPRDYGRWQETPLSDRFTDMSFEISQIYAAAKCLKSSPYFDTYIEIADKKAGAFFTVSKGNNFTIVVPSKKLAYILRYRS